MVVMVVVVLGLLLVSLTLLLSYVASMPVLVDLSLLWSVGFVLPAGAVRHGAFRGNFVAPLSSNALLSPPRESLL